MTERARLAANLSVRFPGPCQALDADACGGVVGGPVRALARAPACGPGGGPSRRRSGRSAGRATSGRRGPGWASACRCCSTSPPAGRGASRRSRPQGRLRMGARQRRGGDPRADVAADVAAGGGRPTSGRRGRWSGSYTVSSAYSLIALQDRVLVARGRRALKARIDLLTRTRRQAVDAQAAELGGSSATCTTARRRGWSR